MQRSALTAFFFFAAACPVGSDPAPPAPVQAVAAAYDFGSRSALDPSPVTHTFTLEAWAAAPVTVDRLQPSCRCTRAAPEAGTDALGRFTIAPGHAARIDVTFDPSDVLPGAVEKEVYVFVSGQSTPAATLHIRGVLTPPVVFSASSLDFGAVVVGEARTLPLTVTLDPRLPAPGRTARLVCSDPSLRVVRRQAASARQLTYLVTVPEDARPGKIAGTLTLRSFPPASDGIGWSVPVRGRVVPRAKARRS